MNVIDIILQCMTLVIIFGPLVVQIIKYIGIKTGNASVKLIAERANIIVSALERADTATHLKQDTAIGNLLHFSEELNIPLTRAQAEQYIESAVTSMRKINGEEEKKTQTG